MKKIFSFLAAVLFVGSMMAGTYTKTAYADLQNGDVVIITELVGTNVYAASNDNGTSAAPTAVSVTVANDAITTDATNILWTVVKDGANISFKTGDNYLYCTNTNNGMRVGSNSNNVFSIDANSGYLYNNGTSRFIGVYNSSDWRCYTTVNANIKDQTLAFYAVGGSTPSESVVANFCQTEVGHLMEATPAQDSYVLLSIGSKGGKTIVRIDQDGEKNTAMFDYLQVTGLTQTGEDVAEGGVAAMAVEFDTPALTNDSMTLEILWSTVNWPGRWMVQNLRVAVADCQYAVVPLVPITCAEVYNMAKNDEVLLNDVTVTFANGKNVWVKDATGSMLVYLPDNGSFAAGDVLSGVEGVVDIYNGVTEVKPSAAQVAAIDVTAGEAPAPEELTAVAASDVNKYVVIKNLAVEGEFVEGTASNITLTLADESTIVLRSNFKNAYAFDAAKTYNITAVVTIYQSNPQLYFISAEEYEEPAPAEPQRNIMAYGLSASAVNNDSVTINYSLNAKAKAVEIQLLDADGDVVKSFDAPKTELAKGAHSIKINLADVEAGSYHWAVKAKGWTVESYAKVLEDKDIFGFWGPRGVAVDNSFESDYFGNIYVTNFNSGGGAGAVVTRLTQTGVYALDAGLNVINESAYQGGLTWGTNSGIMWAIARPCVGPDGTVYIASGSPANSGVWMMNPANPTTFTPVFGGTHTATGTTKEGETVIHNSVMHCYVAGTGADRKLYTFDLATASVGGDILQYNIGELATPWVAGPSDTIYNDAKNGNKIQNGDCSIAPDGNGGWWISQYRGGSGDESVPALFHTTNNVIDYNAAATWPTNYQGGMAVSVDGKTLALGSDRSTILIFDVAYDENNVPTLTKKITVAWTGDNARNAKGLAFDAANNLYVVDNNREVGAIFAINANTEFTTPAKSTSLIIIQRTGTAVDDIYVMEVQKVIRNGQVLIIRDGKTYNMMGQIVE